MRELHCDSDGIITKEIYEPRIEQWNINRYKVFQSLVNKVIKLVGKGAKILDLGAGEGFFARCCQENGLNVVAVEGSPVAVKYARETLNIDSKVHNLKYPLEFEDEAFDLVMYHDIYEHVTPEINDNVFKEVFRMLKPNGFFWVITTCKYDFVECPHPEHINNPTPTSLLKAGRKLGFSGKINLSSFNISLFTPYFYDKELNTKPSQVKIRLFLKKHKKLVTMILAPLWVPIGLLNKHILKLPLLDFIWPISNVLFQKKEAR